MTKSELRSLIKEMLQEELSKAKVLTESPAVLDRPQRTTRPTPVRTKSSEDIAATIYNNPEFQNAFEDDGWVIGDRVGSMIEAEVAANYPNRKGTEFDKTVDEVMSYLDNFTASENKSSDFFDWSKDDDIARIYNSTHDEYGNEY